MSKEDKPPNSGGNNKQNSIFGKFFKQNFKGVEAINGDPKANKASLAKLAKDLRDAMHKFKIDKAASNARKTAEGEGAKKVGPRRTTDVTPPNSNGGSPSGAEKNSIDNGYPNLEDMASRSSNAFPPESPDSQSANCTTEFEAPCGRQAVDTSLDGQQQSVTTTTPQCHENTRENENGVVGGVRDPHEECSGNTLESVVLVIEEVSSSDSEMDSNEGEVELVSSTVLSPTRTDEDLRQESAGGEDNELSSSQSIAEVMGIDSIPLPPEKDKEDSPSVVVPSDAVDDATTGRKRSAEEANESGTSKRSRVSSENNKETEEIAQSSTEVDNVTACAENAARGVTVQTRDVWKRPSHWPDTMTEEEAEARGIPTIYYLKNMKDDPDGPTVRRGTVFFSAPPEPKFADPNYAGPVITISDSDSDDDEFLSSSLFTTMTSSSTSSSTVQPCSSFLPTTTTPAVMSTFTSTVESVTPPISSPLTTTAPTVMSTFTSTVESVTPPISSPLTTTPPTIMSTFTSTVESVTSPISSPLTTTTPTTMSDFTSTVESVKSPISSPLTTTTPTTLAVSSGSRAEPDVTETASFVANTQVTVDSNAGPDILPMPSSDPEACIQSGAPSSDFGITTDPTPSLNSSISLPTLSVSQTEENIDIPAATSTETAVTVSEVTREGSEVTSAAAQDQREASESAGVANTPSSLDETATSKSTRDDGPSETAQVTPNTIQEIKIQPYLEDDEISMPLLKIRTDIFVDDDEEDEVEVEPYPIAQAIALFANTLTPDDYSFDPSTGLTGIASSASELVAASQRLTPSAERACVTASTSLRVPPSSAQGISSVVQIPGTSSATSSSVTGVPTSINVTPTTVYASQTSSAAQVIPSPTVSSTPISTAISTPLTTTSSTAPVSSALVSLLTTSSTAGSTSSTVEVPTTSAQAHERRTSSPAIANSPWSELEEPLKDLNVGMDIIIKAAEDNLAYVKQLAASLSKPSGSRADVVEKMSTLSEARNKSFSNHDVVDNVIISLRLKHPSLSIPEPRVRMEAAKPTVEELAAYFEVLLESVILSKRPHINERMRGVLVVQITRLMRILGHYMHVPENFSRSDQTFTNVLSVLTTKPGLAAKYTTSNLNYMLLNFWQCIRGVTRDTGYAKGAMMDHTNLGPKNFMDRVEKFKASYERNVVARGALQTTQGPSPLPTQSNQPQQQVTNQTRPLSNQQSAQSSASWQNQQQQQQQGATVSPVVRHQQHQFATPSQVVQQQLQQSQHSAQSQIIQQQLQQSQHSAQSQIIQQQPQQNQHSAQSQIVQQQPQQNQYTNQSHVTQQQQQQNQYTAQSQIVQQQQQQQYQYTNQSQVTQQQSQQRQHNVQSQVAQQHSQHRFTTPSQVVQQQPQQHQYANQSQVVQQVQQQQSAARHPQQQPLNSQQAVSQQQQPQHQESYQQLHQLLQNTQTNYQSQIPRQSSPVQYLRVPPTRQEHPQNVSQFQGQINMAHTQPPAQSSSSPQQNQMTQNQLRPQNVLNNTSQQRHPYHATPQQQTPRQYTGPRQGSPNTASMLQRQAHFNMASQQQQSSAGQVVQQSQYLTQQPSALHLHSSPPGARNIIVTTRQPAPAQIRFPPLSQVSEHRDIGYARQQLANANGQYNQRPQSQQQQRIQQQMPAPQYQQSRPARRSPQLQQQQLTTQQQLQRQPVSYGQQQQPVATNTVAQGLQLLQQTVGAAVIDDDIEILEVRPPSNPSLCQSPVEARILLHMGGEQIGSVPYTGHILGASPQGQAASHRRRSSVGQEISLDNMTLEGLLSSTPAANRIVVTPTNVVRPNSRSGLSPISPPVNVATRRTGQDTHTTGTNYQNSVMRVVQSASHSSRHSSRNPVQQGQINIQLNQQVSSTPYNQQNQQLTLTYQQESEPSVQAGNQVQVSNTIQQGAPYLSVGGASASVPARATFSRSRLSGEMNSPTGTIHYGTVDHGSGQRSSAGNYSASPGPELRISSVTSLANTVQSSSRRSLSQSPASMPDIALAQFQANTVYFPDTEGNSIALQQPGQMRTQSNNTTNYNGVGGGNYGGNNHGNT